MRCGDGESIARRSIQNGASLIIAVGGDGTLNEVVNGFYQNGSLINPDCEFGIINCGSGAGFANSIGLPESPELQLELIRSSDSRWINLGKVQFQRHDNDKQP